MSPTEGGGQTSRTRSWPAEASSRRAPVLRRDRPAHRTDVLLHVGGRIAAGDGRRHLGMGEDPVDRRLRHGAAMGGRDLEQDLQGPARRLVEVLLQVAGAPGGVKGAVRRRLSGGIHAGEQAHAQGTVSHDPKALVALRRPHLTLQFSVEEVVGVLDAEQGIEPEAVLRPQRLEHLPGLEVGDAHVACLAGAHHVV